MSSVKGDLDHTVFFCQPSDTARPVLVQLWVLSEIAGSIREKLPFVQATNIAEAECRDQASSDLQKLNA